MDSLHAPCTKLKKQYDSCFNHWFEEYLALAAPAPLPSKSASAKPSTSQPVVALEGAPATIASESNIAADTPEAQSRQAQIKAKAAEYERRCGDTWRAYRTCLEAGLEEKELKVLIAEAREEFPLKKPKEVDMEP